jgi:chromosome segregation ATPase
VQAEIADVKNRAEGYSREAEELEARLAEAEERKVKAEQRFSAARTALQSVKADVRALAFASAGIAAVVIQNLT